MPSYRTMVLTITNCCLLVLSSSAHAQFDRIDQIVSDIESRFASELQMGAVSPDAVKAGVFEPEVIDFFLLKPLIWETEKLDLQIQLMDEMRAEMDEVHAETESRARHTEMQLFAKSIRTGDDMGKLMAEQRTMEHDLQIAEAEIAGLRAALQLVQNDEQRELQEKQAKLVAAVADAQLERAQLQVEAIRKRVTASPTPEGKLQLREAELMADQSMLESLTARLQQNTSVTDPQAAAELRKAMAKKDRLAEQLHARQLTASDFGKLNQQLSQAQQQATQSQSILQESVSLQQQIRKLNLERRYLGSVIARYQSALESAQAKKDPTATE